MNGEITISPMAPHHGPAVARVHCEAFSGYFLSRLGPSVLSVFYGRLARDPQAAAVVARAGEDVVGFAAGVLDRRRFTHTFVFDCWPVLGACVLGRSLARPRLAWEMASRLPRLLRGGRPAGASLEAATLLSVGVLPAARGRGVGRRLVAACAQGLREKGGRRVLLETDDDNAAANAFYLRCGFRLHRRVTLEQNRAMTEYLLEFE